MRKATKLERWFEWIIVFIESRAESTRQPSSSCIHAWGVNEALCAQSYSSKALIAGSCPVQPAFIWLKKASILFFKIKDFRAKLSWLIHFTGLKEQTQTEEHKCEFLYSEGETEAVNRVQVKELRLYLWVQGENGCRRFDSAVAGFRGKCGKMVAAWLWGRELGKPWGETGENAEACWCGAKSMSQCWENNESWRLFHREVQQGEPLSHRWRWDTQPSDEHMTARYVRLAQLRPQGRQELREPIHPKEKEKPQQPQPDPDTIIWFTVKTLNNQGIQLICSFIYGLQQHCCRRLGSECHSQLSS